MPDYVILHMDAPMMSMGAGDNGGTMPDDFVSQVSGAPAGAAIFPNRALLTGLLANAFGYERYEGARHQLLSDRLSFAAGVTAVGSLEQDFQTSALRIDDRGWTTRGYVEGRRGGLATYESAHVRRKWSWADAGRVVALRLLPGDGPTTADAGAALDRPERPLFLGRKAYPPATPLRLCDVWAATAHAAMVATAPAPIWGAMWDRGEGPDDAPVSDRDERHWRAGVYAGSRPMHFDVPSPYGERHL